jgi:putative endonuclease
VVFIEVKTRSGDKYGHPFDAVTPAKQKKNTQAAQSFISRYKVKNRDLRFDAVAVTEDPGEPDSLQVELLQDAFRL